MKIIQSLGKRKHKVFAGKCIFGVAAVDCVSSESWRVTEIFETMLTIPTLPVSAADPGDAYAATNGKVWIPPFHDFTYNLMTRNDSFTTHRQFAFDDVKIGAANATGSHP
jgi:hypothetical protein